MKLLAALGLTAAVLLTAQPAPVFGAQRSKSVCLQVLKAANTARKAPQLQWCDFRSANLVLANLYGANLSYAWLHNANLTGADLRGANFYRTVLWRANFSSANLYRATNLPEAIGLNTVNGEGATRSNGRPWGSP